MGLLRRFGIIYVICAVVFTIFTVGLFPAIAGAEQTQSINSASSSVEGLIAHWPLNEGKGSIARDISGNGADCDLKNTKWSDGPFGKAVDFNGINSYLEARDAGKGNITGAFTISFWMKPQAWKDQYSGGIISKRKSDAVHGYVIYSDGNFPTKICLRISGPSGGEGMLISASDVDEEIWQHWAVTYNPQTKSFIWYKNGKLDKRHASVIIGDTSNDTPLQIGHAHTWNGFYDGLLNNLKIYNRALTLNEIKAEYGSNAAVTQPVHVPIKRRVISTHYPTSDIVIAGCTVKDAGARGDGKTDDTEAFQSAMNTMARVGGGTVFVPEGRYVIKGNLKVPTGVTLRGEWQKPSDKPFKGSILMAYVGRGETEGRPFIALRQCTGIIGLTIWYPEQNAENIVPYPFCIQQMGAASGTVSNVTLVNAYQGIRTNYGSYLHYFHSVYGSPLSIGLEIDFVSDTGRVDDIHFNPDFWSNSGLPGSPKKNGAHAAWMRKNGTGMLFRRYEWIYSAFVELSGYNTGVGMINSPTMGETNGQMYKYEITNCNTAVDIINANFAGISFTKCLLEGSNYGVFTHDTFNSRLLFHSCDIRGGKKSAFLDGIDNQTVMFQHCSFTNEIERIRGDIMMLGCSVKSSGDHIRLGRDVNVAAIAGTVFDGEARVINSSTSERVKITSDPVAPTKMPDFPQLQDKSHKPAKSTLYVITPQTKALKDYTQIIQKNLDAAAKNGGGIVYIAGGIYPVRGNLVVPSGVELRGVYDVTHHSRGLGSVLQIYAGRNNENAKPFIVMKKNSGMRGLSFYYPEQQGDNIVPYPFLVQGRGENVYIVNINAMNPYKMIDFKSYRCDRHYIDYPSGAPLKVGVAVGGGSTGGIVLNAMFNSNNWAWSPYPDSSGLRVKDRVNAAWIFQYQNLDGFIFGDCKDELQYQNSIFGSHIGLHFVSENGTGASGLVLGHGTDGSLVPIAFDGLGPNGIDVINSQLVSMYCVGLEQTPDKRYIHCGKGLNSTARMYNTTLWGTPNSSVTVQGGSLDIELASFCMNGPLVVDSGDLRLTNIFLGQQAGGDADLIVRNGGQVSNTGILSLGALRINKDAEPGAVTSILVN
ncbi:MAG: LamG domain-containing protein [Armatimonadota bacterium]